MSARAPIKDGGPAFPHFDAGDTGTRPGMSLRDYFAANATELDIREHRRTDGQGRYIGSREEARFAYADAMLAAREAQR